MSILVDMVFPGGRKERLVQGFWAYVDTRSRARRLAGDGNTPGGVEYASAFVRSLPTIAIVGWLALVGRPFLYPGGERARKVQVGAVALVYLLISENPLSYQFQRTEQELAQSFMWSVFIAFISVPVILSGDARRLPGPAKEGAKAGAKQASRELRQARRRF